MEKFKLVVEMKSDMKKILVSLESWQSKIINNSEIQCDFILNDNKEGQVLSEELNGINALIFMSKRYINEISLQQAGHLKWIGRFGSGFENVDIDACTEKGILVSNTPQGVRESVSEAILGYMLALSTRFVTFNSLIRKKGFKKKEKYMTDRLYGKTVGIIGFGSIGSRLSELVKPLEMEVLVYDPHIEEQTVKNIGAELVDLDYLLRNSDFVSLNVPLTRETKGMLGLKEFKKMKNTAYFINTCRGGIYRDAKLAEALKRDWLKGAALDVFEDEPDIEDNPLLKVDSKKTILTPHIAGARYNMDAIKIVTDILIDSVLKVKNGYLPQNIINPEAVDIHIPPEKRTPSFRLQNR